MAVIGGFGDYVSEAGSNIMSAVPNQKYEGSFKQGMAANRAQAYLQKSKIQADAIEDMGKHQASAIKAGGQARAQASMAGSLGGAASSLFGTIKGLGTGKNDSAPWTPVSGSYSQYASPSFDTRIGWYSNSNAPNWPTDEIKGLNWSSSAANGSLNSNFW